MKGIKKYLWWYFYTLRESLTVSLLHCSLIRGTGKQVETALSLLSYAGSLSHNSLAVLLPMLIAPNAANIPVAAINPTRVPRAPLYHSIKHTWILALSIIWRFCGIQLKRLSWKSARMRRQLLYLWIITFREQNPRYVSAWETPQHPLKTVLEMCQTTSFSYVTKYIMRM